jgi:OOP family OmpA-OmpF porin
MKQFIAMWAGAFLVSALLAPACSFSVGNMHVLKGKDQLVVKGTRPDLPPKLQPPPPPPKPMKAKVVGKKIEITEKVMFEYDKATISTQSHELLNDVATVMKENPNVKKIRIEGHTDGDGTAKYNRTLSQGRADAVRDFLVNAGVDTARMESVGYGEDKPIADNKTEEGKEANRRVEFNILEQEEKLVEAEE